MRRGLHRIALAALAIWEGVTIVGAVAALFRYWSDPYRGLGVPADGGWEPNLSQAATLAVAAVAGLVCYVSGRWIARGFLPDS